MPSAVRSVWYNMPELVLILIFERGAHDMLQDDGLPFALLVSHVCRGWRITAARSPSVWSAIPVHSSRPGLLEYFLARCGAVLPLSLCFHVKSKRTIASEVLALGLSQPERVREVHLRAHHGFAVFLYISQLRQMSLPRLVHFEINLAKSTNKCSLGPLPAILNDNPPATLSSVVLEGVSFRFQSPMLKGLTRLTLADLPREFAAPSYVTFRNLLLASPMLEYLKLDHVFPVLTQVLDYGQIVLPTLHTLDLVMEHDAPYVSDFFLILSAPHIHTLLFATSSPTTCEGFEDALRILRASFENLHTLRLSSLFTRVLCNSGVQPILFDAFPELRCFVLTAHSDRIVMHYLEPWIASTMEGCEVWPKLELLTVRSPFGDLESEGAATCVDDALELLADLRCSAALPFDVWQEFIVPRSARTTTSPYPALPSYF
ncbi:uncharacterized protein PHACADRAFT_190611 [Phanerochaete carnosa HHB-10118-sp]|uniref:F-box domain-containing protein n=1 Tax=Phanerochaete carnosa (strain HHB-10118-sp) TaxID=650164 RepID=K5XEG4_PHACS|nr:uncharacterized protein PHACADRAFT_190611 [Phanerochaete carnosa HHB-10118-sp]EKM61447.1 hypothetical protein PHACADRAFT_190611 [Phanerochaete carnosa HHB-10118-sp]